MSIANPSRSPLKNHLFLDPLSESTAYAEKSASVPKANVLTSGSQPNSRLVNVNRTTARTPQALLPVRCATCRKRTRPRAIAASADRNRAQYQELPKIFIQIP